MRKPNPKAIGIAAALAIVLLSAGAGLQRAIAPLTPQMRDSGPSVPSRALAQSLFLGYNGLAADVYWTDAIQYFGQRRMAQSWDYPKLAPLLNLAYDLDPNLIAAAQYGAFFLADDPPEAAGQPQAAVALLRKAIHDHPDDWHLYFNLGFVQALNMHDHKAAAETFYAGSKVPHANPALAVLAADYFADLNERQLARALWTEMYRDAPNPQLRENALDHLQAFKVEDDLAKLASLAQAYHQRTSVWPQDWRDLERAGLLPGVPLDPQGHPYRLLGNGRFGLDPVTKILALKTAH